MNLSRAFLISFWSLVCCGFFGLCLTLEPAETESFVQDDIDVRSVKQESEFQDHDKIRRLIQQFNSDRYSVRIRALNDVVNFGHVAIEPLRDAALRTDPETRLRALEALKEIAKRNDASVILRIETLLNEMALEQPPAIAQPAATTLRQLQVEIQSVVVTRFRSLGAELDVYEDSRNRSMVYQMRIGEQWKGSKLDLMLLRRCEGLRLLEIVSDQVDDEILELIATLNELTSLELEGASIDNNSVIWFREMPKLQNLELRYLSIDDDSIPLLARIGGLSRLGLIGTRISDEGRAALEQEFRDHRLDYRRGGFFGVRYAVGTGPCILTDVIAETAAANAGLKTGDKILTFNGNEVANGDDFRNNVSTFFVGDTVTIEVLRDGEVISVRVQLGKWKM